MQYKIIAIDVDGTLVNSQGQLTERTKEALIQAQERFGIRLIIASGRPIYGLKWIAEDLRLKDFGGYLMPFNGGAVYSSQSDEPMVTYRLPIGVLPELYALSREFGVDILSYQGDEIITEHPDSPYVQMEVDVTGMSVRGVPDFVASFPEMPTKCLITGPKEVIAQMEAVAVERLRGRVSAFRSNPHFLELMPWGINKAYSIAKHLEQISVDSSELIAVGDSYNDLEMIQMAGLGVAMANAAEPVKACAEYVTKSNDQDGIVHLLDKYVFDTPEESKLTIDTIESFTPNTLMESLGIRCIEISKGRVVATMPVDKRTRQPLGIIHGGANLALAETVAGLGSIALLEDNEIQVGVQVSGNHVASAIEGDTMRAEGTILHSGRSTHVWSIRVYSENSGKLIHTATVLNSILKKR